MAKRKVVEAPTVEQQIEAAVKHFDLFDKTPPALQPLPTREFTEGEEVKIGNLKEVFIVKKMFDGMAYLYKCRWSDRDNPTGTIEYRIEWWYNIDKKVDTSNVPRLMAQWKLYPASSSDIDSLLGHLNNGGLVVDPRYQRDYVWTEQNKDALIESIFDHLDIGSFLFIRHAGFNHEGDQSVRTYRTMDGRLVDVKRCEDYTTAIIDGQQRLTTIIDFVQNRRPYKGIYFSQMNYRDQIEFLNKSVMYRIIEEEKVTEKEVLRMFLQSNRGVPQTPEHIAKIQAMYDSMQ